MHILLYIVNLYFSPTFFTMVLFLLQNVRVRGLLFDAWIWDDEYCFNVEELGRN